MSTKSKQQQQQRSQVCGSSSAHKRGPALWCHASGSRKGCRSQLLPQEYHRDSESTAEPEEEEGEEELEESLEETPRKQLVSINKNAEEIIRRTLWPLHNDGGLHGIGGHALNLHLADPRLTSERAFLRRYSPKDGAVVHYDYDQLHQIIVDTGTVMDGSSKPNGQPGLAAAAPPRRLLWTTPVCKNWALRKKCAMFEEALCAFAHPPRGQDTVGGGVSPETDSSIKRRGWGGTRNKLRNREAHSAFRVWLSDTYGLDWLRQTGEGRNAILDVGGGQGSLAFELNNCTGAKTVCVIDPRPLFLRKMMQKWKAGYWDRQRTGPVFARYNPAAANDEETGEPTPKSRAVATSPLHLQTFFRAETFYRFLYEEEEEGGAGADDDICHQTTSAADITTGVSMSM